VGECQVDLDCWTNPHPDAGSICRYPCTASGNNCPSSYPVCSADGFCSVDGGAF